MVKRAIIEIDRNKCNGCGNCTTACAENALMLDEENKAVLVKEIYCDGLGACLDVCPTNALKIVERESKEYDAEKTYEHVAKTLGPSAAEKVHRPHHKKPASMPCGCPSTMAKEITKKQKTLPSKTDQTNSASELSQWPIQLHLVMPSAPYFNKCDLLIAADCSAFSLGSFHNELLKGKKLVIACPKLDNSANYEEKLTQLIKNNTIYSITVAIMSVPCCSGLFHLVQRALQQSGKNITSKKVVIDPSGEYYTD